VLDVLERFAQVTLAKIDEFPDACGEEIVAGGCCLRGLMFGADATPSKIRLFSKVVCMTQR
jgi:hypothetical protein